MTLKMLISCSALLLVVADSLTSKAESSFPELVSVLDAFVDRFLAGSF